MVVLTIVTQQNGQTIYFEEPIPKGHFMKLISCSLYNSWDTLKREGSASLGDKNKDRALSASKILPGLFNNLESMAKEIQGLFAKYKYDLVTEINQPLGQLVIKHFGGKPTELDRDLAGLFNIKRNLAFMAFVKRLTAPTTYFIHCNLIDTERNLFNGKKVKCISPV